MSVAHLITALSGLIQQESNVVIPLPAFLPSLACLLINFLFSHSDHETHLPLPPSPSTTPLPPPSLHLLPYLLPPSISSLTSSLPPSPPLPPPSLHLLPYLLPPSIPLYKGQVKDGLIQWNLSTRDKLKTGPLTSLISLQGTSWGRLLCLLYSGASLQGTSWGRLLCLLYSGASLQGTS